MQQRVQKFTRGAARGLRRVDKAMGSLVKKIRSATSTAAKLAAVGIGTVTAGVGLLIREFSKIEDAEAAFTPLLGGADRARKMVDALNDTAATTPFQFETLAGAANQLLPVMNGNIEKTIKTVRMLGDTAGGNAQKLDSITRGFTKAMLKGKVDMESLNMIAEAGVPIFQDLAEVMGMETGPKFFKMISSGKVTTEQLTKAFEKLTGEGGKFYKGMEISSRTTSGLWSTLKDNISLTAAEIGGALAPTIKELIKEATVVAQKVRQWAKDNRELIGIKFKEYVDTARKFVVSLAEGISWLVDHGSTLVTVVTVVGSLVLVLKTLIGVMTLVNLVMTANPIGLIVAGVVALIAGFTALVVWIDDVISGFKKLPVIIQAILLPIRLLLDGIKFIKDAFGGGFDFAVKQYNKMYGKGADETPAATTAPQVVSPQERTARLIEEKRSSSTAEVTIKDETGRAAVTGGSLGRGVQLQPSGAF